MIGVRFDWFCSPLEIIGVEGAPSPPLATTNSGRRQELWWEKFGIEIIWCSDCRMCPWMRLIQRSKAMVHDGPLA